MSEPELPKVGDVIYIDTELYVFRGADDVRGGKATVCAIRDGMIEVAENPGTLYTWSYLAERQAALAAEFGDRRAYRDPDLRPEFNDADEGWT